MDRFEFSPMALPATGSGQLLPREVLGNWLQETHARGRRRLHAIAALHERVSPLGLTGCAIVGGLWLSAGSRHGGTWRLGPWQTGAAPGASPEPLWAEGAGDLSQELLQRLMDALLADPERSAPAAAPRAWRVSSEAGTTLILDTSLTGRRQGFVVLHTAGGVPVLDVIFQSTAATWTALIISGLLRGDGFRTHWETLSEALIQRRETSWYLLDGQATERPVNPQEVVMRVSEAAHKLAADAARAFEVSTVGVFLPDPDDEYVYCLGASGSAVYAYDAGLHPGKPRVPGVGFGLTASYTVGAAYHPSGSPVVVRTLPDRDALRSRYRDLGFDEDAIADGDTEDSPGGEGGPLTFFAETPSGPFLGERFIDPALAERANRGPWVFTAQQLPRSLSPSGRNLVVRFQGRIVSYTWATPTQLARTSQDRQNRMASLAMRIHAEICQLFAEGLAMWRDGVRDEVLRELSGACRWSAICQTLAAWLSARTVSLFRLEDNALVLQAWSAARPPPELRFDVGTDLMDSQEMRLLQAPLYPRRERISEEGFLGWAPFEEAANGPAENVGCVPILSSGRAVGLIRVDGAMSLFGGHIRRQSLQPGLHHHRPGALPAHLRPALEEAARLLSLSIGRPRAIDAGGSWSDWSRWARLAAAGRVDPTEARERLDRLRSEAPTRAAAAELVGVHRNTFRRQLAALSEALGAEAVAW